MSPVAHISSHVPLWIIYAVSVTSIICMFYVFRGLELPFMLAEGWRGLAGGRGGVRGTESMVGAGGQVTGWYGRMVCL